MFTFEDGFEYDRNFYSIIANKYGPNCIHKALTHTHTHTYTAKYNKFEYFIAVHKLFNISTREEEMKRERERVTVSADEILDRRQRIE